MTITDSFLRKQSDDDVDLAGTITAVSDSGVPAQLSFGMDQQYCCDLEIWGSKGCIQTPRVYTAPADYNVNLTLTRGMDVKRIKIDRADQFALVADTLAKSTKDPLLRASLRDEIRIQSRIIDGVLNCKGMF